MSFGCSAMSFGCSAMRFGCSAMSFGCSAMRFACTALSFGCSAMSFGCSATLDQISHLLGWQCGVSYVPVRAKGPPSRAAHHSEKIFCNSGPEAGTPFFLEEGRWRCPAAARPSPHPAHRARRIALGARRPATCWLPKPPPRIGQVFCLFCNFAHAACVAWLKVTPASRAPSLGAGALLGGTERERRLRSSI